MCSNKKEIGARWTTCEGFYGVVNLKMILIFLFGNKTAAGEDIGFEHLWFPEYCGSGISRRREENFSKGLDLVENGNSRDTWPCKTI